MRRVESFLLSTLSSHPFVKPPSHLLAEETPTPQCPYCVWCRESCTYADTKDGTYEDRIEVTLLIVARDPDTLSNATASAESSIRSALPSHPDLTLEISLGPERVDELLNLTSTINLTFIYDHQPR